MGDLYNRVYSAINAGVLKPGDKVIVADSRTSLRYLVENGAEPRTLKAIKENAWLPFQIDTGDWFTFAYLVKRKWSK